MPYRQARHPDAYARNRFADAVPLLQRAAALDPDNPVLEFYLARLYLDLGDDVEATRVIEAARKRWPDDGAVLMVSAEMHMNRANGAPRGRMRSGSWRSTRGQLIPTMCCGGCATPT